MLRQPSRQHLDSLAQVERDFVSSTYKPVSWEVVCLPRSKGGLGDLNPKNQMTSLRSSFWVCLLGITHAQTIDRRPDWVSWLWAFHSALRAPSHRLHIKDVRSNERTRTHFCSPTFEALRLSLRMLPVKLATKPDSSRDALCYFANGIETLRDPGSKRSRLQVGERRNTHSPNMPAVFLRALRNKNLANEPLAAVPSLKSYTIGNRPAHASTTRSRRAAMTEMVPIIPRDWQEWTHPRGQILTLIRSKAT